MDRSEKVVLFGLVAFFVGAMLLFGVFAVQCEQNGGRVMKTLWNTYECVK